MKLFEDTFQCCFKQFTTLYNFMPLAYVLKNSKTKIRQFKIYEYAIKILCLLKTNDVN